MTHPAPQYTNARILVVDDEPYMRQLVSRILTDEGYEVHAADDGLAAKEIIAQGVVAPDLVLTDIQMPLLDGIRLGRAIAELRPGTPVAYMSGYGPEVTAALPADLLENCFITKPFSAAALLNLIRRCMRTAETRN